MKKTLDEFGHNSRWEDEALAMASTLWSFISFHSRGELEKFEAYADENESLCLAYTTVSEPKEREWGDEP